MSRHHLRLRRFVLVLCILVSLAILSPTHAVHPERAPSPAALTVTLYADRDAYVLDSEPTTSFGTETILVVGRNEVMRDVIEAKSLVAFNLTDALPAGATFVSASLEMDIASSLGERTLSISTAPFYADWSETKVTWNSMPAAYDVGDPASSVSDSGTAKWDVTNAVNLWLVGEIRNYGLLVMGDREAEGARSFSSRETRELREGPRLIIEYELNVTATPTEEPVCEPIYSPDNIPRAGVIDFDDLSQPDTIGNHYETAHGVIFEDGRVTRARIYAGEPDEAHSPPNVASNQMISGSSADIPMHIAFTSPKTHVGMYIGNGETANLTAELCAYDVAGVLLCCAQWQGVPEPHTQFLGIHDSGGRIMRVTLDYGNTSLSESIDDFTYAPAGPGPTLTPSATPTLTRTPTRTPTPTRTLTPSTDLVVDRIEVTQGVQDLNNSVKLVAGKRTFVRVHCHSTSGTHPTYMQLRATRGGYTTLLSPLNAGSVSVRTSPNRGTLNHAFLFELPSYYRSGSVTLTAYLNPNTWWRDYDPLELSYWNNTRVTPVTFHTVPTVPMVIYRVGYRVGGTTYYPSVADRNQLVDWLRRAYPVSNLNLRYRTIYLGTGTVNSSGSLTSPNCGSVNSALLMKRVFDILFWSSVPSDAHYYGMVDDANGTAFMRGCAMGIPAYIASGPTGSGTWGWDTDGSYGDWYGAHELGHTYGRGHANFCGAGGGPAYPYANGRISPSLSGNSALYGFDISTREIYGPNWKDLMSYCDYEWLSDFTYEGLMSYFQTHLSSASLKLDADTAMDRLLVVGSIHPMSYETHLSTLMVIPDAQEIKERVPGDFDIVLIGPGEEELARYPFTPENMAMGPNLPSIAMNVMDEDELWGIYELVPWMEGTLRVEIHGPTGLLASISAGPNPPTVTVVSPNGGEIVMGDPVTVSWEADDADGDPLSFRVQFSADDGANWELVADEVTGTEVDIDAVNIAGTEQGLFRVWVSDGMNTAYDDSDAVFTVPNRPPEVDVVAPAPGTTVALSQTVSFEGFVYDPDTGTLPEEQLVWTSDRDGELGQGAILAVASLSEGDHLVTLTADDGQGGVAEDTVTVHVLGDPAPAPLADALVADPAELTLKPGQGLPQVAMLIENPGGSPIAWEASTEQAWITLSASSGATDAEVMVSYNDVGLPDGWYLGEVLFTSLSLPGQSERVEVTLYLGDEASLLLPLVLRQ